MAVPALGMASLARLHAAPLHRCHEIWLVPGFASTLPVAAASIITLPKASREKALLSCQILVLFIAGSSNGFIRQ